MNNQEKEFNEAAEGLKRVSLSANEKSAMLKSIYTAARESSPLTKNTPSPFVYSSFFKRRTLVALTVVFLMTATTSYASLASMGSLPGDPLYQMKVDVIEPIGLAMRLNEEERNDYRLALLKERVAEIEHLKESDRLMSHNEMASYRATQRTIADIEASSAFAIATESIELISAQVETYNALIAGEAFKLKTSFGASLTREESADDTASTTLSKDAATLSTPELKEVEEVTKEIEGVAEEAKEPIKEVTKKVEDIVEGSVKPVIEKVAPIPIPKIINP